MSINGRYFKTIANIIKINEFLKIGKPNISFALKKQEVLLLNYVVNIGVKITFAFFSYKN